MMMPRLVAFSLALGAVLASGCAPRRSPVPEIKDADALPATSEPNPTPKEPEVVTAEPKKPEPAPGEPAEPKPAEPADITLSFLIDDSKVATECPAYQTTVPAKNAFTVQMGEIGDIIAKGTAASRMTCTLRGQVVVPSGYLVDLNVDSLKVLGSAILSNVDSVDYSIKVETVNALQFVYRYQKLIIGPKRGPFEALLDTQTPTVVDPPCSKESMAVPFNILIQTTLRAATNTPLAEVEGFLNRTPNFAFRYRPCKAGA